MFFFIISLSLASCLSDSEAIGQSSTWGKEPLVQKIVRDSVFLKNGKRVHIPGINSGTSKVLILTRHAEKDTIGMDPGLSRLGEDRATQLADLLQATPLKQIFITHFRRVFLTVKPLSTLKRVGLQRYEPGDQKSLMLDLNDRENGVYVVVGHSNSIPEIIGEYTGENVVIEEGDYGGLWIIELSNNKRISKFRF